MASLDEETTKKVIRQVEFYFSDSNLPRDNFLRKTITESEDGLIDLALICSFSRMRGHLGLGDVKPEDIAEDTLKSVAATLRTSSSVKISEDGKKIGRTTELPKLEEVIEQVDGRTVAASPLEYDAKLEDVESYFAQFGKVNSVRMPRHVADKRLFCGTALIEFATEEDAESVLKQNLVYGGAELELKPKKDFDAERATKIEELEKSRALAASNRKDHANGEADYPKGLIIAFTLKSILAKGSTEENDTREQANGNADVSNVDKELSSSETGPEETEQKVLENIEESKEEIDEKITAETEGKESEDVEKSSEDSNKKGALATYKDNMDVIIREDLKSVFEKYGNVKFIDFKMGEESGYIRFEEAEAAQKARAAAVLTEEGGLIVKNYIATLEPVSGDAEKDYWNLFRGNYRGNRGGRGGRFNRGGKRGRGRGGNDFGRPNKAQKV